MGKVSKVQSHYHPIGVTTAVSDAIAADYNGYSIPWSFFLKNTNPVQIGQVALSLLRNHNQEKMIEFLKDLSNSEGEL